MAQIEDFFFESNSVRGITEDDYLQAKPYVEAAKAFAQATYQSIYIIDYYRKNFLYVSENPLFLCGHTAEEVRQMGYGIYINHVPAEEQSMLTELNRAGFTAFDKMTAEDKRLCIMSYDFHLQNGTRQTLINHKIKPLVLMPDGRIWLNLCVVSLSSNKTAGHIQLRMLNSNVIREYSLTAHRWRNLDPIILRPEEKEILTLAAQGYTIKEIGEKMFRGVDTVKFYRKSIFEKFGTDNITEALTFATNYGLL